MHTRECMCVYTKTCMRMYVHVCVRVCVCMCTCVCMCVTSPQCCQERGMLLAAWWTMDTSLAGVTSAYRPAAEEGLVPPPGVQRQGKKETYMHGSSRMAQPLCLLLSHDLSWIPWTQDRKRSLMPTSWTLTSPRAQCHSHIRAWAMIKPNLNIHTFLSHFLGLAWASVHSCDSHIVPSLSHKQNIWSCAFTREDWSLTPLSEVIAGKQEQRWIPSSPQVVTAHSTC